MNTANNGSIVSRWRVLLQAIETPFIAQNMFERSLKPEAMPKIYGYTADFWEFFLSGQGTVENPTGETLVTCYDVSDKVRHQDIIDRLGGPEQSAMTLGQMYMLMQKAFTDMWYCAGNVFYIPDQNNILRVVVLFKSADKNRNEDGWNLHAYTVDSSRVLDGNYYVFAPKYLKKEPVI